MVAPPRCATCGARTNIMGNGGAYCNKACAAAADRRRTTGAARESALALGPRNGRRASRRPPPPPPAPPTAAPRAPHRRPPPHKCRDQKCPCRGRHTALAPLTHARIRNNVKPDADATMNRSERSFASMVRQEFRRREWTLYPQVKIYNPHGHTGGHIVADFIAVFGPARRGPLAPAEIAAIELDGRSYHDPRADKARDNYAFAMHGLETWRAPSAPMLDGRGTAYSDRFFAWADDAHRIVTSDARRIEAAAAVARHGRHLEAIEAEARRIAESERPLREAEAAAARAAAAEAEAAAAEKRRLLLINEANYSAHRARAIMRDPATAPPSIRRLGPPPSRPQRLGAGSGYHIPAWRKGLHVGPGAAERRTQAARQGAKP